MIERSFARASWTMASVCFVALSVPVTGAAAATGCDLLSAADAQQALGKPGKLQDATPTSCRWFAPVKRMLSIRIDPALVSDPGKQLAMLRSIAQKMSPKHTFQDEPTVAPLAFSETSTISEWLVRVVKGRKVAIIKVDDAPGGLDAARRVAKLVYARM